MNKLILINYSGKSDVIGNIRNTNLNFKRDSGIDPFDILDQMDREELLHYLLNYSQKSDKLIIHIKAHGFSEGICQTRSDSISGGVGDINSLIRWEELINIFNTVAENCTDLIVNLGTVCNSIRINYYNMRMNFDALVTIDEVTDPVLPRKLNKELLLDIENVNVEGKYMLLRKAI